MAHWLQSRLKKLGLTHDQFVKRLAQQGIKRTRVTVTNWVNGTPITLLMNPADTKRLALALDWSVDDLLMEAGYEIGEKGITVPPELVTHIRLYKKLVKPHSLRYIESITLLGKALRSFRI
jgi:hypothetical protein